MNKLEGCVALVTGAGRGIGAAIAMRYAREGARVAVADIDEESTTKVAQQVSALGRESHALVVDVRDPAPS